MKDQFEHILKEKLQDFSLERGTDDWVKIERSLGLEKPKRVPLFRYVAAVAAVLLVGFLGFYWLDEPDSALENKSLVSHREPENSEESIEQIDQASGGDNDAINAVLNLKDMIDRSNRNNNTVKNTYTAQNVAAEELVRQDDLSSDPVIEELVETALFDEREEQTPAKKQEYNRTNTSQVRNYNTVPASALRKNTTPNSNWALSLFSDGSVSGTSGNKIKQTPFEGPFANSQLLPEDGLIEVKIDKLTGLLSAEIGEWDHNFPLTFGAMVRRGFNEKWGLEIGVTYSYLSSKQEISTHKLKQKLHYLGIPLAVTYTPFRTNNFEFYARAGGAADFNLSREITESNGYQSITRNSTASGVQWSLYGNIGVMYNVSPKVGLYVEPGLSHYFKYSHQPDSYWREHPTNFNFKIGVRTTF